MMVYYSSKGNNYLERVNLIERTILGYYNFMSGKSDVRDCMYLNLDKFLSYDVSSFKPNGDSISIRFADYVHDKNDRELKIKVHGDIFNVDYDCRKVVNKLCKSPELKYGYGMFIVATDKDSNEKIIGSADILKYGVSFVLGNFGLIEEYRGKGYSRICIYNILSAIVSKGIKRIYLYVRHDNEVALKIYESFGFKRV